MRLPVRDNVSALERSRKGLLRFRINAVRRWFILDTLLHEQAKAGRVG